MTSPSPQFKFAIEFHRTIEGALEKIATCAVEMDWQSAKECAQFERVRRNSSLPLVLDTSDSSIAPSWDPRLGQPYIDGVVVQFANDPDQKHEMLVPTTIFKSEAQRFSSQLIEQGKLEQGERFRYRVCAYAQSAGRPASSIKPGTDLSVEQVHQPLNLVERQLVEFERRSVTYGPEIKDEIPVIIPRHVVNESVRLTKQAGAAETGGVLVGHLHRDPGTSELYARVTAQVPARRAEQSLTKLTFTPQVWADVDGAIRLRNGNEIHLGWWHSHPARQWCKDCPVENRKRCKLSGEFFSSDDVALHQCVFPMAYCVALVISDSYATGLTWPLFGWNRGIVAERGYLIYEDESASCSTATTVVNN